jgi:cytochrome P450
MDKTPIPIPTEFRRGHTLALDPATCRLDQIDLADPDLWAANRHHAFLKRLRHEAPVHYCADSDAGPYWSVLRYDDIFHVDTHHDIFSSEPAIVLFDPDEDFQLPMFIAMDPPKHDAQRKAVQPIVGGAMLEKLEPLIRERAGKILDELPVGETFDWVDRVSIELTSQMLATLFDFPYEDRRKLTRWSDVATGRGNPDIVADETQWRLELLECAQYFSRLWDARKDAPPSYDLISLMSHDPNMRSMPPQEFLGNLILLIVGGNDTTRNSITGGVYALNTFPEQFARLKADPGVIPNMVSEIIRWQTPLAYMRRTAKVDAEIRGQTIKAGDKVLMWYLSGNRDEAVFERGEELWIDRPNPRKHLAFGYGIHRCVGMRVGEMQLRIIWEEILKRFGHVEVMAEPTRVPSAFVHGYSRLEVRLHPR